MIGIPLFLIAISNLSGTLSNGVKMIYSSLINCFVGCCSKKKKNKKENTGIKIGAEEQFADYVKNENQRSDGMETRNSKISYNDESEDDEDDDDDDYKDGSKIRVYAIPLEIIMLILISYVVVGIFVFSNLEDWTYIQSFYFTFTTIATIGSFFFNC